MRTHFFRRSWIISFLFINLFCGISFPPFALADDADSDINGFLKNAEQRKNVIDSLKRLTNMEKSDERKPFLQKQEAKELAEQTLSHTKIQSLLQFLNSSELKDFTHKVSSSPDKVMFFWSELSAFILLIIFRAWRSSNLESKQWFKLLLLKTWTLLVYAGLTSYVIPTYFFGSSYLNILKKGYEALKNASN